MALESSELRELREGLRASVGERTTELLMSHLPTEEVVTKTYLDEALEPYVTKTYLDEALEPYVTKTYLDEALERFATKEDLERFATKDEMTEFRLEFVQFRGEMREEFAEFRGEVQVEMRDLMREQTRNLALLMTGTMIALVGAMFARLAGL